MIATKIIGECFMEINILEKEESIPVLGFPGLNLARALPLNILLAEDNIVNQKIIMYLLTRMGYTVDVVDNGIQVLDAMKQKKYDLIMMDIQMPLLDGIETTKQIMKLYEENERPKIIAITANDIPDMQKLCFDAGMVDYMRKPMHLFLVFNIIKKWGEAIVTGRK